MSQHSLSLAVEAYKPVTIKELGYLYDVLEKQSKKDGTHKAFIAEWGTRAKFIAKFHTQPYDKAEVEPALGGRGFS
jgi:hypothetical protein